MYACIYVCVYVCMYVCVHVRTILVPARSKHERCQKKNSRQGWLKFVPGHGSAVRKFFVRKSSAFSILPNNQPPDVCRKKIQKYQTWFFSSGWTWTPRKKNQRDFRLETWRSTFGPFFELVQNTTLVRFSYLLRLCNFCKAPRDMRKFPQKCQKIAGCWGRAVYVHNFRSLRHLAHPIRNDRVQTISRGNHGLTQRAPVPPLEVLTSALSRSFCLKRQNKVLETVLHGHVASDHGWLAVSSGPGRSTPSFEAIRGCVHERRALNTQLSSITSVGTFAVSAGPYRNYQAEAGTKNAPDTFFVPIEKKGKINPHVSNIIKDLVNFRNGNLRSSVTPPIVRSELGGSWRRLSEKQNISCKLRFVKSESQSTFQLFVLSLFWVLRVRNWSWNWNNQKEIAFQKKLINLKELGKYIQKKFDKYVNLEN